MKCRIRNVTPNYNLKIDNLNCLTSISYQYICAISNSVQACFILIIWSSSVCVIKLSIGVSQIHLVHTVWNILDEGNKYICASQCKMTILRCSTAVYLVAFVLTLYKNSPSSYKLTSQSCMQSFRKFSGIDFFNHLCSHSFQKVLKNCGIWRLHKHTTGFFAQSL